MSNLFIRIKDGQPFEHPIFGDNFRDAFPDVDPDNLPPEFARFERIPQPVAELFEVVEGPVYQWVDGVVKDVWTTRPMTSEEKAEKLQDMSNLAVASVEAMKSIGAENARIATDEAAKAAWLDFVNQLNAWVLVDPLNPKLPTIPILRADGTMMTTTAPGSMPNVIG